MGLLTTSNSLTYLLDFNSVNNDFPDPFFRRLIYQVLEHEASEVTVKSLKQRQGLLSNTSSELLLCCSHAFLLCGQPFLP